MFMLGNRRLLEARPSAANLWRIFLIRMLVLAGQVLALVVAKWHLQLQLAYLPIILVLITTLLLTAVGIWRLYQAWPVSESELFGHLLVDFLSLSFLLYFIGGATNPFVSYYLIPLTISAATLSQRYTWTIAVLSLSAYSLLLVFYQPLDLLAPTHQHHGVFNMHLMGMLATFAISVLLITFFIVNMAATLRKQEHALGKARENTLRNEHIVGIATLAAGTAHQLGTPLATIAVLASEIKHHNPQNPKLVEHIELISAQVAQCKSTLQSLSNAAEINSTDKGTRCIACDTYIAQLIEKWRSMRPDATPNFSVCGPGSAPQIVVDTALDQAICNILNNAEDASPGNTDVSITWDKKDMVLSIQDHGDGIAPDIAEQIGKPFFTTKTKGLGLGLFLSNVVVERLQGSIKLYNNQGTLAQLSLPIKDN